MKVELSLESGMRLIGKDDKGLETFFDAGESDGGKGSASSPMAVFLEAAGACSAMDVLIIIRKKRRTINDLKIFIEGERAADYPKVYTKVHVKYILYSPDAKIEELQHAVELSHEKYCSASAMFEKSGCEVTWSVEVKKDKEENK
jgi:putative redox protein